ncbi:MAG: acyltransferase [Reichenbachiella sp.]|uniref:acyltransferase n=1 Tax=Reichenbachiella sp. TaxID=2184521 RepID=UPI003265D4A3
MKYINVDNERQNLKNIKIGEQVKIYDFVNAYDCQIGAGSKIGTFVEIQAGCIIGENCKISSHTFICTGVTIEDGVFVGHNVSFINDLCPRAVNVDGTMQTEKDWQMVKTLVKAGASIGTSVTILGGITIGRNALIGAGSVVTKDVPDNAVFAGNPAKLIRMIK